MEGQQGPLQRKSPTEQQNLNNEGNQNMPTNTSHITQSGAPLMPMPGMLPTQGGMLPRMPPGPNMGGAGPMRNISRGGEFRIQTWNYTYRLSLFKTG